MSLSEPLATAGIVISINGEAHTMSPSSGAGGGTRHPTLAALLAQLGHEADSVATAVNGEFIARAKRDTSMLQHGDRVTCFKPIVGG